MTLSLVTQKNEYQQNDVALDEIIAITSLLCERLDSRTNDVRLFMKYYDGDHNIKFATEKFRRAFNNLFNAMSNNWMQLIVDSSVERLQVRGFRVGHEDIADDDAWKIWRANNMDALSNIAHTDAVKCGESYLMITPRGEGRIPLITVEHPLHVYVQRSPENPLQYDAAVKRWVGSDGYVRVNLYLPTAIYRFVSQAKKTDIDKRGTKKPKLTTIGVENNPLGMVPIVPLTNNLDLIEGGRSDLEVAIPLQDVINKYCLDMQVSSEHHAFPQRTATGWEVPTKEDGEPDIAELQAQSVKSSSMSMLVSESPDTKFGTLTPGDVRNYIEPIEMAIDHLAALTRTPAYYLKGKMANLSADALRAADAGLVSKCERKQMYFGDGWEQTLTLSKSTELTITET